MGIGDVDEQIALIVELLIGNPWAPAEEPTPIYDDIVAAREAGFEGEYHVHWRLEQSWSDAAHDDWLAEQEAEHFGMW